MLTSSVFGATSVGCSESDGLVSAGRSCCDVVVAVLAAAEGAARAGVETAAGAEQLETNSISGTVFKKKKDH